MSDYWLQEMIETVGRPLTEREAGVIWDEALSRSGVADLRGYRRTSLQTLEGQLYGLRAYMDRSEADPRGYMIGISDRDSSYYATPYSRLIEAIKEVAKNPPICRPAHQLEVASEESAGFLLTEEEAKDLPEGALFTGTNGQWYIRL
jgi:hypothetical protein